MAIIQRTVIGRIEVLEDGQMQIREERITEDDQTGEEVAGRQNHRKVIDVGDDITNEDERIKAVAAAVWTPAVRQARIDALAALEAEALASTQ